jgi:hypothetical protein
MDLKNWSINEFGRVEMKQIIVLRGDLDVLIPKGKRLALAAHLSNFNTALQLKNRLNQELNEEWLKCPHKIVIGVNSLNELNELILEMQRLTIFGCDLKFLKEDIGVYDMMNIKETVNYYKIKMYSNKSQAWKEMPDSVFTTVGACFGPIPDKLAKKLFRKYPLYDIN